MISKDDLSNPAILDEWLRLPVEVRAKLRARMQEAGARNSKMDKERLVQIVMSALSNLSAADREQVLKDALKQVRAKKTGGKK